MKLHDLLTLLNEFELATSDAALNLYTNPIISDKYANEAKVAKDKLTKYLSDLDTKVILTKDEYNAKLIRHDSESISTSCK